MAASSTAGRPRSGAAGTRAQNGRVSILGTTGGLWSVPTLEIPEVGHVPSMSILASARQAGPSALISTVSRSVGLGPVRPWLPAGQTLRARVFRHGLEPGTGVEWVDEAGVVDAQVRLSYAATAHWQRGGRDQPGAAARQPGRHRRRPAPPPGGTRPPAYARATRMLTAATPYLVAGGWLLSLGARQCGAETFELCCAAGDDDEWRSFADLRISPRPHGAQTLHADPLANVLPGLEAGVPAPRAG